MEDLMKDNEVNETVSSVTDIEEPVETEVDIKTDDDDLKFDTSTFLDNNDVFGLDKYIVVGALYLTDKPKLTKKEFLELVDKFLRG